jgi:hypothetical protein
MNGGQSGRSGAAQPMLFKLVKDLRYACTKLYETLNRRALQIRPIRLTETCLIRASQGKGKTLVLVFGGARLDYDRLLTKIRRGIYSANFATLVSRGRRNHIIFVDDLMASYFSPPAMRDLIVAEIAQYKQAHGIETTYALGSSMGGYGAILFSQYLAIKAVLAFAPALSLEPEILDDPAWALIRGRIGPEVISRLQPILHAGDTRFYLVFGDQDQDDCKHLALVPQLGNTTTFVVKGCDHGVAGWLKKQGHLGGIIRSVLADDAGDLQRAFAAIRKDAA